MKTYEVTFEVTIRGTYEVDGESSDEVMRRVASPDFGDDFPVVWPATCELIDWDVSVGEEVA